MKVIDFHTHIFDDRIAEKAVSSLAERCNLNPVQNGTKSDLLSKMDLFGVDRSVVLPIATKPSQTASINKWAVQNQSDKLTIFGTFHPDSETAIDEIDSIAELGLKGIKLHPDYQGFFVDELRMFPLYERILSHNLILIFHCGVDIGLPPPVHCPPERLRRVLDVFKGGKFVASHLGGFRMWDETEKYLVGQNVYLDTSMGTEYYPREQFLRILKNHGEDKILFASDSPWSSAGEEISNIKSLGLSEITLKKIFSKNAEELLI